MLLAAAGPDWFARWVALLGLVVSSLVLVRQLYRDRKDRHQVDVTLQPAYRWLLGTHLEAAVVTVRTIGRPITVENVALELVDLRPAPQISGWRPYLFLEDLAAAVKTRFPDEEKTDVADLAHLSGPGMFSLLPVVSPNLPHLLVDGAVSSWAYRFAGALEPAPVPPFRDSWLVVADVTVSNGKTYRTKPAPIRLRAWHDADMSEINR